LKAEVSRIFCLPEVKLGDTTKRIFHQLLVIATSADELVPIWAAIHKHLSGKDDESKTAEGRLGRLDAATQISILRNALGPAPPQAPPVGHIQPSPNDEANSSMDGGFSG